MAVNAACLLPNKVHNKQRVSKLLRPNLTELLKVLLAPIVLVSLLGQQIADTVPMLLTTLSHVLSKQHD
jgi:hypothetical protein